MPDTVVVILAGGAGRRIGGFKPEQCLDGNRLVDISIQRACSWGLKPALSVRFAGQVLNTGCEEIIDVSYGGPISGLIASMKWAEQQNVARLLILPCDMPFLPDDLFSNLVRAQKESGRPVVAASGGRWHPVCALWPVSCLPSLQTYADAGGSSLIGALKNCAATSAIWSKTPLDPFMNVNTPEDLGLARKIARSQFVDCEERR